MYQPATLEGPDALHKKNSSGGVRPTEERQTSCDDRPNWTEPTEGGLPDDHRAAPAYRPRSPDGSVVDGGHAATAGSQHQFARILTLP